MIGGRVIRGVVAGAVGTVKEVDVVGAQVLVEWDVDFEQWSPLSYAQHLLFEGSPSPMGSAPKNAVHPGPNGV